MLLLVTVEVLSMVMLHLLVICMTAFYFDAKLFPGIIILLYVLLTLVYAAEWLSVGRC